MRPGQGRPSPGEMAANRRLMGARGWGEALAAAAAARAAGDLNAANACAALGRLAKLPPAPSGGEDAGELRGLLLRAAELAAEGSAGPRQLSGILWACARLAPLRPVRPCASDLGAAAHAAAAAAAPLAPRFKPQELSNALWALARGAGEGAGGGWEPWRAGAFGALAGAAARSLHLCGGRGAWTPQALSNLAWALGACAVTGGGTSAAGGARALLDELLRVLGERAGELNPQETAGALGALARLSESGAPWATPAMEGGGGTAAVAALAAHVAEARDSLSPRQVANATWALAKLGELTSARGLLLEVARGSGRLAGMNCQELSMCAWTLATSAAVAEGGAEEERAAAAVFAEAAERLRSEVQRGASVATGLAQPLATTAWAAAKIGRCEPHLGNAVARACLEQDILCSASARDLANLAWGAAKLGAFPGLDAGLHSQMLAGIFAEAAGRVAAEEASLGLRPVIMLLWAMASSKWRGKTEVGALLRAGARLIEGSPTEEASSRDLADLAFALGALRGPAELAAPEALRWLLNHLGGVSADKLAGCNAQELLRLLGGFRRAGGKSKHLDTVLSERRTAEYQFGELEVCLQAAVPTALQDWKQQAGSGGAQAGEGGDSKKRKRVDDCCGGTGRPNTGVALWQAGYFLAEWLSRQGPVPGGGDAEGDAELRAALPERGKIRRGWSGRVAVELGAGLGLPSIVGARVLNLRVVATDGDPDALHLLRENARDNVSEVPDCVGSMRVEELRWGSRKPLKRLGLKKKADLVMASDVVYGSDPEKWRALLDTLKSLCGKKTLAVIANMQRYPLHHKLSEARVLERELEGVGFEVMRAPQAALHPDAQGTGGANSCALFLCRHARKQGKGKMRN